MGKAAAALFAMTALTAGIMSGLDPVSCLGRGLIAGFVGWILGSIWQAAFLPRSRKVPPPEPEVDADESTAEAELQQEEEQAAA
ncbi:MAG: hypothetical protein MH204_06045 [Fimbriimonadaceae bacterium]|nr:hypothetical protein [Fimbriimonadaceae bacterium]